MRYLISSSQVSTEHWYNAFPNGFAFTYLDSIQARDQVWIVVDTGWQELVGKVVSRGAYAIVMTLNENGHEAKAAFALGARAYVHVFASDAHVAQVSDVVERGGVWIGAELMQAFIAATSTAMLENPVNTKGSSLSLLDTLTERERQVADCVASGASNKEIARELLITERTVKAHLGAIFEKLSVRDRLHLALLMKERANTSSIVETL
jgi:DNA-binding NarL/FixJ family response regulator